MTWQPDHDILKRFAQALLRNEPGMNGRFKAACEVTPDTSHALLLANQFYENDIVLTEIENISERAKDEGLDALGTKFDFAKEVLSRARSCTEDTDAHKFFKLYSDIRGWTGPKETNVNIDARKQTVMIVTDMGTNDEWADKAARQQRQLMNQNESGRK